MTYCVPTIFHYHPLLAAKFNRRLQAPARCIAKAKHQIKSLNRRLENLQLIDLGDKVRLSLDLPGVKSSDLQIEVKDRMLSLSAVRHVQTQTGIRKVDHHRRFRLHESIDPDHVTANLADGVLVLTAPKVPTSGPKTIHITHGNTDMENTGPKASDDQMVALESDCLMDKESECSQERADVEVTASETETGKSGEAAKTKLV